MTAAQERWQVHVAGWTRSGLSCKEYAEEWPPLFGDPLMASAAMDRLLHHSQVLELDGNSFRNPPRRSRPAPPAPPSDDAA